ncbi:bifunctional nicotinamidase/pyrazinamidase [Poriferisphaera sp. WC338]|uniref:bifunctional nicotinamidase/pyrazinamidase n=1 Tax=Poriferisphaera sp. WC338 TaxID=3425129 RepID=UPI003D81438C
MRTLLLIDIQNDFLPGGALAVPHGDEVIAIANTIMSRFDLVVASQDWHPTGHVSFAASHAGRKIGDMIEIDGLKQMLWPTHCVQNSKGAAFPADLNTAKIDHTVHKGTNIQIDSYSTFFDNGHRHQTGLDDYLKAHGCESLYVMGLATDYCVKSSVLDALKLGYQVHVIIEGIRGVEVNMGDCAMAIDVMMREGAEIIGMDDI